MDYTGSEVPKPLRKGIDSLIDWNSGDDHFVSEDNLTPMLPRDETIYSNNNKDRPFSEDGIDERSEACMERREARLSSLKEYVDKKELVYLKERLGDVRLKIENNKIHSRFEILDL